MRHLSLEALLHDWRRQLSTWSRSGDLEHAARRALQLVGVVEPLRLLTQRWGAGDLGGVLPVVVLPGAAMPEAAGAYALGTGTIFLNREWLERASHEQALAVLTEELGHHLDGLLNSSDTPGDEGERFAALLLGHGLMEPANRTTPVQDTEATAGRSRRASGRVSSPSPRPRRRSRH